MAVEVSHYDPSNIALIPRISVSSSPDLWISAAGVDVLHQDKKSFFGPMFSVSSESVKASDREAVVWTKMSLLIADRHLCCVF